jgi:uncharacterized metal-binding protein YceD (DUF177 family)
MTQESTMMAPEWSHIVQADDIGSTPEKFRMSPKPEEIQGLCQRLGIEGINALQADVVMSRNSGNRVVHVKGTLTGELVQNCVLTLEELTVPVSEEFEAWFADPDATVSFTKERQKMLSNKKGEDLPILDEKDDPEALIDGVIDVGEVATQFLLLAIDLYPQAEGALYDGPNDEARGEHPSDIRKNPFAALKDWKDKL